MVYFQTKSPDLGNFWKVFQWKMSVYFTNIMSNLHTAKWLFSGHFVHLVVIWHIYPILLCRTEKNLATLPRGEFFKTRVGASSCPRTSLCLRGA
jgi:hypothetical protein